MLRIEGYDVRFQLKSDDLDAVTELFQQVKAAGGVGKLLTDDPAPGMHLLEIRAFGRDPASEDWVLFNGLVDRLS